MIFSCNKKIKNKSLVRGIVRNDFYRVTLGIDLINKSKRIWLWLPTRKKTRLYNSLKNKKNIKGGMYPKLTGAIDCLEKGVKNAHIVDGRVPHSVLIELLTDKGVGTWICK